MDTLRPIQNEGATETGARQGQALYIPVPTQWTLWSHCLAVHLPMESMHLPQLTTTACLCMLQPSTVHSPRASGSGWALYEHSTKATSTGQMQLIEASNTNEFWIKNAGRPSDSPDNKNATLSWRIPEDLAAHAITRKGEPLCQPMVSPRNRGHA